MTQGPEMIFDMIDTVYESIDRYKNEDFWEVIESAIVKSLGIMTGYTSLGEYERLTAEDLEALDEIRYVAKYIGEHLPKVDGLEKANEEEAKMAILTLYVKGRSELDARCN